MTKKELIKILEEYSDDDKIVIQLPYKQNVDIKVAYKIDIGIVGLEADIDPSTCTIEIY